MPGFLISNLPRRTVLNNYATYCYQSELEYDGYWAKWNTLNKYMQDKLFCQNEHYILILEGVVLNKSDLCNKYKETWEETLIKMYEQLGVSFMKELRGSFSGALYDKKKRQWLLYVDPISTKPLYYYMDERGFFACGTQINYVTDTMKENGIRREADEHGLSCLLVYASFMDESTGVRGVSRLFPGDYLLIRERELEKKTYYQLTPQKQEGLSSSEYIDRLDKAFRNTVKCMLDKDVEYGYKTVIDISGGVDSRMIAYVAKSLGYENVITITYSQSGGRESKIAQEVANKLKYEYYFKSMDNGNCMFPVDQNVLMNNGSQLYTGITCGRDMLELLNPAIYGIELTGLLGDIYDGSMVVRDGEEKPYLEYAKYRFGTELPYDDQTYSNVMERFDNHELFWYYVRGMIFGMSSFPIRQNFVEPLTPFGSVEFMETYLSIPWRVRVKDKLQCRWMVERYPEAGTIPYAATGISPAEEFTLLGKGKKLVKFVNQEVHRQLHLLHRGYSMNPTDYWCEQRPEILEFMHQYYLDNIDRVKGSLREKIEMIMRDKYTLGDKELALTVLSYYKQFLD